jgi:hypothetical protein
VKEEEEGGDEETEMEEEERGEDRDKEMQEEEREAEENSTVDLNLEAKDNEKTKVSETVRVLTLEVILQTVAQKMNQWRRGESKKKQVDWKKLKLEDKIRNLLSSDREEEECKEERRNQ